MIRKQSVGIVPRRTQITRLPLPDPPPATYRSPPATASPRSRPDGTNNIELFALCIGGQLFENNVKPRVLQFLNHQLVGQGVEADDSIHIRPLEQDLVLLPRHSTTV